ncbi:MAG: hypothetical protein ACREJM_02615 [Candidatus Saccharimonadales bacterium]
MADIEAGAGYRLPKGVDPLLGYAAGEAELGSADYPEFDGFVAGVSDSQHAFSLWRQLAALNAYAAGLPDPAKGPKVGRLTPGRREGLGPFMFDGAGEIAEPGRTELAEAHVLLDGLYAYMSYPRKIVITNFGPKSRNMVHGFLNHRIEAI